MFSLSSLTMGSKIFSSTLMKNHLIVPTAQMPHEMWLSYINMQFMRYPWHLMCSTYVIIIVWSLYLSCYGESKKLEETLKCQRAFFSFLEKCNNKHPFHQTLDIRCLRPCSRGEKLYIRSLLDADWTPSYKSPKATTNRWLSRFNLEKYPSKTWY